MSDLVTPSATTEKENSKNDNLGGDNETAMQSNFISNDKGTSKEQGVNSKVHEYSC